MLTLRRLLIMIGIGLILMSIYHDLSKDLVDLDSNKNESPDAIDRDYSVVSLKIVPGDTLLSINEQINPHLLGELDIDQLLRDFSSLNPSVDPQKLIIGNTYLFPAYHT